MTQKSEALFVHPMHVVGIAADDEVKLPFTVDTMPPSRLPPPDQRLLILYGSLLSLVQREGRDLTVRQLSAFLTVYMNNATYTVSSLADVLHISRPGATRVMDRLEQFSLIARGGASNDRRCILVRRTARGAAFFRELTAITRYSLDHAEEAVA